MSWAADAYLIKSSCLLELKNKVRELIDRRALKAVDPADGLLKAGAALPPINLPAKAENLRRRTGRAFSIIPEPI